MRGKELQVGDTVLFQLYNSQDHRFYGEVSRGTITEINVHYPTGKIYNVMSDRFVCWKDRSMWLHRNEIKRVIK